MQYGTKIALTPIGAIFIKKFSIGYVIINYIVCSRWKVLKTLLTGIGSVFIFYWNIKRKWYNILNSYIE